jgi:hypothetical protein
MSDKLPICEGCDMEWPPFNVAGLLKSVTCSHCRRAYAAGIAAEKQRQNSYVEQAYERPDEGAMVE